LIAHVNDIRAREMNDAISIRMSRSVMEQLNLLPVEVDIRRRAKGDHGITFLLLVRIAREAFAI
jgi:hypothetical protein